MVLFSAPSSGVIGERRNQQQQQPQQQQQQQQRGQVNQQYSSSKI
jgi:hypothetical protein